MANGLSAELLTQLAAQLPAQALATLAQHQLLTPSAVQEAAQLALANAPTQPAMVARWLPLLATWLATTGGDPGASALFHYAQARLAVEQGDWTTAESSLQQARTFWTVAGDAAGLARSGIGLTQLLTMQARFAEAEAAIRAAIATLESLTGDSVRLQLWDARQNLATLLSYQEHFDEALAINEELRTQHLAQLALADPASAADLQIRLGLIERDLALAHTYLDRPEEAERLLTSALERLSLPAAQSERGQTHTNLGHLYTRTGRYAEAVTQFDKATLDLLGTMDVDAAQELWPTAGVLFLEQATVYLALNLLPEASTALQRARQLLAAAQQRYELGQALYLSGRLAWQRQDTPAANEALTAAAALYAELDNDYWQHRVRLAQAAVALQDDDLDAVDGHIAALLAQQQSSADQPAQSWDQAMTCELHLLTARSSLAAGNLNRAAQAIAAAASALKLTTLDTGESALPHLHLQLLHVAGQIERAQGRSAAAQQLFIRALDLVEAQRGLLPIEELRTSFLSDKSVIYVDLVLSLLEPPQPDAATLADAFAVVERARSRSLLERLLTSVDSAQAAANLTPQMREQMTVTRRRLHWLYNQLLGGAESEDGSRGPEDTLISVLAAEIRAQEATLQRLEWQRSEWLEQAQPVTLPQLQQKLAHDQVALVYFMAAEEVLAFIVAPDRAAVVRNITTTAAVQEAQAQLRFQLGRVEIGVGYPARHAARLLAGAQGALRRLHELLIDPVQELLAGHHAQRLLVIPYGSLHQAPFHAFWDGEHYLLETYEISYAASASLAVHQRRSDRTPLKSLAALALHDAAIPQAEREVQLAARHFAQAHLFLHTQANESGLQEAAQSGDVLHIATHGVFRADNPFFSALKLADGWFDVRSIYRLTLRARLVVLSACESGAVQVQGNDEAIGLARGFLGAGAESLAVSLWNVHDASAAYMMDTFYAHLIGQAMRPAAALRAVQQEAARDQRHPYYWAPYVVIGDLD